MKKWLVTIILIIMLLSSPCVFAKASTTLLFSSVGVSQPYEVQDGMFSFDNLQLYAEKDGYTDSVHLNLYGSVTNKTSTNWKKSTFGVAFLDKDNNVIYSDNLIVWNLGKDLMGRIGKDVPSYSSYGSWFVYDKPMVLSRIKDIVKIKIISFDGEPTTTPILQMIKPSINDDLYYSDDYIAVQFSLRKGDSSFGIALTNKTGNAIRIDWNQISYINLSGTASPIIHEGVKLIDGQKGQIATMVPPTAKIVDVIAPVSNYYYQDGSGWKYIPLLPEGRLAYSAIDKPFSIFMPLEINGGSVNYLFSFKISSIQNQ